MTRKWQQGSSNIGGGMFYCLGMIGVFIYYVQQSQSFVEFLVAIVKALLWPAFLAHKLFGFLGL